MGHGSDKFDHLAVSWFQRGGQVGGGWVEGGGGNATFDQLMVKGSRGG